MRIPERTGEVSPYSRREGETRVQGGKVLFPVEKAPDWTPGTRTFVPTLSIFHPRNVVLPL